MKKIIMILGILVSLTAGHCVFSQTAEGTINYEVKVNMHRRLPSDREGMKEMMPEFNVHQDILFFNSNESLYKTMDPEVEPDEEEDRPGPRMMIRRPRVEVYSNRQTNQLIKQQEFIGKRFLIHDTLKVLPWKLGADQKQIMGYSCKQAIWNNEERNTIVTAWYADGLPPFLGPEGINTLPGTILQLDFNNGERIVTATKIESRPLAKNEMKVPDSGQRVTSAEFKKIVDTQMKKMGGNGNIIIRN